MKLTYWRWRVFPCGHGTLNLTASQVNARIGGGWEGLKAASGSRDHCLEGGEHQALPVPKIAWNLGTPRCPIAPLSALSVHVPMGSLCFALLCASYMLPVHTMQLPPLYLFVSTCVATRTTPQTGEVCEVKRRRVGCANPENS